MYTHYILINTLLSIPVTVLQGKGQVKYTRYSITRQRSSTLTGTLLSLHYYKPKVNTRYSITRQRSSTLTGTLLSLHYYKPKVNTRYSITRQRSSTLISTLLSTLVTVL